MATNEDIRKVLTFIMFAFSGLFFIAGCAFLVYHVSIDDDLISIIKGVSPTISASIVSLYWGFIILYAHRKEKISVLSKINKIVLYFVIAFIGVIIVVVGFMEEIWGVCPMGLLLVFASLIETYKIMKCKNDQSK